MKGTCTPGRRRRLEILRLSDSCRAHAIAIAVLAGIPRLLADTLREEGLRVVTAGDCVSPREVDVAMAEEAFAAQDI